MPEEQDQPGPERRRKRVTSPAPRVEGATPAKPRKRTPSASDGPQQPVDFQAAAQRLTARAAQIARLKTEVEHGAYRADPAETARAMERRSDA